jgi:hypothetical protein
MTYRRCGLLNSSKIESLIKLNLITRIMLFGVFAVHSPESCPLNNQKSKRVFLEIQSKMKANVKKFGITKIIGFYMSVLEHEWIIILDAKSAHDIEQLCITVGISSISTVKIVPMNDFSVALKRLQSQK